MRVVGNIASDSEVVATASGAITAGKPVVVNSNGTVSQVVDNSVSFAVGSNVTFETGNINFETYSVGSTFDSSNNKVVLVYSDNGNSNYGTAVVGNISGSTLSFGTPTVYESAQTNYSKCTFDSDTNKVIIAYSDEGNVGYGKAVVGTVSGTSISFGSIATFNNGGDTEHIGICYDSNASIVFISYRDNGNSGYGFIRLGEVSGTSISFGTNHQFNNNSTKSTSPTFDSANNKVVLSFSDTYDGKGRFKICTVNNASSVTIGSLKTFETGTPDFVDSCFDSDQNKTVVAYEDTGNSEYGTVVVIDSSGNTSTPHVFNSAQTRDISCDFNPDAERGVISYNDGGNSNAITVQEFEVTNNSNSISTSNKTAVNDRLGNKTRVVFDSNANKFVVSYLEFNDSSGPFGQANIVTSQKTALTLTSENFIGFAKDAVADGAVATLHTANSISRNQSSLTAGQTYFVQNDATLSETADTPSVTAGTAISATELIVKG